MTVSELIAKLQEFDQNAKVKVIEADWCFCDPIRESASGEIIIEL